MEKPKFPNLLILEHLKGHFIKPSLLNKFFICFEINELENLKLTIFELLAWNPHLPITVAKTFLLLKHYLLSINLHKFT